MTLNSLSVARCTSARPALAAPGTSSVTHRPDTVSQPSIGLLRSSPSCADAEGATEVPSATAALIAALLRRKLRLELSFTVGFQLFVLRGLESWGGIQPTGSSWPR